MVEPILARVRMQTCSLIPNVLLELLKITQRFCLNRRTSFYENFGLKEQLSGSNCTLAKSNPRQKLTNENEIALFDTTNIRVPRTGSIMFACFSVMYQNFFSLV